jgi:hypothetical protein
MLRCFAEPFDHEALDRRPIMFKHTLGDHPALSLDNLAKVLPAMPPDKVYYSKGLTDLGINFDTAHVDHPNGLSIGETIESIRTSNSYMSVNGPHAHPSFKDLFEALRADALELMGRRGAGGGVIEPALWLFIASPNAVTPFHCDRYTNFLMQFRGSKEVAIFNPWNDEVISAPDCESWVANAGRAPAWRDEAERHANKYDFSPGQALHIPFVAGHYVKNGSEDVSISLSFFFHTSETERWSRAMKVNHRVRPLLGQLGLDPISVGKSPAVDAFKADVVYPLWRGAAAVRRLGAR